MQASKVPLILAIFPLTGVVETPAPWEKPGCTVQKKGGGCSSSWVFVHHLCWVFVHLLGWFQYKWHPPQTSQTPKPDFLAQMLCDCIIKVSSIKSESEIPAQNSAFFPFRL